MLGRSRYQYSIASRRRLDLPSPEPSPRAFARLFAERRAENRLALLPYLMAGYPSYEGTLELLVALTEAGADAFELGVPFSDPIADGPTVQRANQVALKGGMTPTRALQLLVAARKLTDRPIALMGYMNPIERYGPRRYCADAAKAGANGLIVPDVPYEESEELSHAAEAAQIDLISFVALTTPPERIKRIVRSARGFIYCVGVTGVTGARHDLDAGLAGMLANVRAVSTTPLVVGFGISRPEHLAWLRGRADGAITASAIINIIESEPASPVEAAAAYIRSLRAGADGLSSAQDLRA